MLRMARPARNEGGVVHQIAVIIGVSIMSGVLIAGLALPWIALAKQGAEQSASAVANFPLKLQFKPLNERTKVLDSEGNRIATFYDENRQYVKLSSIAPIMRSAIISIEDARFYDHGAIDVKGTLRALLINSANSGVVQGGSSITQQLVKLTRLEDANNAAERNAASADTFQRKFEELRYAVWVEDHLTKDQILERYLNIAYFGAGAYGIQAASYHYFGVSADELTLPQAAMLAGLVKNPTGYDPTLDRTAARDRRDTVIDRMLELHLITTDRANVALKSPLGLKVTPTPNGCVNSKAPWFCDYLQSYLLADPDLGKTVDERRHMLYGGGLTIRSTVNLHDQQAADEAVSHYVYPKDQAIGGLAMVEPGTGYVRGLAQSRPMGDNAKQGQTYLNYVVPKRYGASGGFQPGSTFKLFVLASAIKDGIPLNTTINAPPEYVANLGDYEICNGQHYPSTATYTFHNSTDSGNMNLYTGTRLSVNTFYVQLELMTGLCQPWHLAKAMGVHLVDPAQNMTPSLTLGTQVESPLEMAEAYATVAARGEHCDSTPVLSITDRDGDVMPTPHSDPSCNRVFNPDVADAISSILKGVIDPGGFADAQNLGRDAAGKTGTIDDQKAVWFVGYTPNLAAAAMIAGANRFGTPITLNGQYVGGSYISEACGSCNAAPIWGMAMRKAIQYLPVKYFQAPSAAVIAGQTTAIPSLYGYSPSEAASILSGLGFHSVISTTTVDSGAPLGTVAYTSPSGEAATGQTVIIYLSNGHAPPPPPGQGGGDGGGGGNGDGHGGGNGHGQGHGH
jgi:membrane peptidoglycan carboxypeptidase